MREKDGDKRYYKETKNKALKERERESKDRRAKYKEREREREKHRDKEREIGRKANKKVIMV